jgi:hypothetical protein
MGKSMRSYVKERKEGRKEGKKKAEDVTQVIEYFPSKYDTLSLNP